MLPLHDFERALFFEGCLPVEEMARRGVDTLRYGPMKPVGLTAPDGSRPYAVVQLRQENLARTHFNLVGFQSRLKWGDQQRVLRTIPGLERAEFVRLGQVHRNTFVCSPVHLDAHYRLKARPAVRLAGQVTGVEGYLESAATGLAIGALPGAGGGRRHGRSRCRPPPASARWRATSPSPTRGSFQPANVNWGLFLPLPGRVAPRRAQARLRRARRRRAGELGGARRPGDGSDAAGRAAGGDLAEALV